MPAEGRAEAGGHLAVLRDEDGVVLIEMGEPGSLNLWNRDLENELFDALESACADQGTRVVGLISRGRAFCGGADLQGLQARLGSQNPIGADADALFERRVTRLTEWDVPIVAAINGSCVGIGMALALACDIRIAATDAVFQSAFPKRGLIAEHGTAWLLPRIVGMGDALDMLLTSRAVTADEALMMRLVGRLVEPLELRAALEEILHRIASTVSPRSTAVIKHQIYRDQEQTMEEGMRRASLEMAKSFRSPDAQEGAASFLERRPAEFPAREGAAESSFAVAPRHAPNGIGR